MPPRQAPPTGSGRMTTLDSRRAAEHPIQTAEPLLRPLVPLPLGGVAGGAGGRPDEGPAQVLGSVSGERSPAVSAARLADDRAQACVSGELLGRAEPGDVADLGGDRVGPGSSRSQVRSAEARRRGGRRPWPGAWCRTLRPNLDLVDEAQAASPVRRQGLRSRRLPSDGGVIRLGGASKGT